MTHLFCRRETASFQKTHGGRFHFSIFLPMEGSLKMQLRHLNPHKHAFAVNRFLTDESGCVSCAKAGSAPHAPKTGAPYVENRVSSAHTYFYVLSVPLTSCSTRRRQCGEQENALRRQQATRANHAASRSAAPA